jgi:hypothetical protein
VASVVERNHASAGPGKRRDPTGMYPIYFLGGSETVHKHDRRALAFVEIGNLDVAIPKT